MTASKKNAPASVPAPLRVLPTHMNPLHPNYSTVRAKVLRAKLRATAKTKMGYWFRRKHANSPDCFSAVKVGDLIFPTGEDFAELDATVRDFANLKRMRQGTTLSDCYAAVDRRCPRLGLSNQINQFIDRATKEIPPRPMEQIMRIKDGGGEHGTLAAKFLNYALEIRKGEREATSVVWHEFTELFLRYRNDELRGSRRRPMTILEPRIANANGNPELIAYAVFMEIEREDRLWVRKYFAAVRALWDWIEDELKNVELLRTFSAFFVPSIPTDQRQEWFKEDRERARRGKAAERKRRQRANKNRRKA